MQWKYIATVCIGGFRDNVWFCHLNIYKTESLADAVISLFSHIKNPLLRTTIYINNWHKGFNRKKIKNKRDKISKEKPEFCQKPGHFHTCLNFKKWYKKGRACYDFSCFALKKKKKKTTTFWMNATLGCNGLTKLANTRHSIIFHIHLTFAGKATKTHHLHFNIATFLKCLLLFSSLFYAPACFIYIVFDHFVFLFVPYWPCFMLSFVIYV